MRKRGDTILYLTCWDNAGIIKIGISDSRRWQSFRNARLTLALPFSDPIAGYDFEGFVHRRACSMWSRAFTSAAAAIPYLSGRGAGYLECYQAASCDALDLIASQYDVTVRRHGRTYERDGRTNEDAS